MRDKQTRTDDLKTEPNKRWESPLIYRNALLTIPPPIGHSVTTIQHFQLPSTVFSGKLEH
jgi:hypothetical protein